MISTRRLPKWHPTKKSVVGLAAAAAVLAGGGTAGAVMAGGSAAPAPRQTSSATGTETSVTWFAASPLASLVRNGTITQAQATAVQNGLFQYMQQYRLRYGPGDVTGALQPEGPLAAVLGQQVTNGTISQGQSTAIGNAVAARFHAVWPAPATSSGSSGSSRASSGTGTTSPQASSGSTGTSTTTPQASSGSSGTTAPQTNSGSSGTAYGPGYGPYGYGPGMMGPYGYGDGPGYGPGMMFDR